MTIVVLILIAFLTIFVTIKRKQWIANFKGYVGERKVSFILDRLPPEYITLNDVIIPTINGTTQIDHIVLSPYGIFVIETKNYTGRIYGGDNSEMWTQIIWKNRYELRNPIKQNYAHVKALQSLLNLPLNNFIPIIAFSNKTEICVFSNFIVVHYNEIKSIILQQRPIILSTEQVQQYVTVLQQAKINNRESSKEHITNIISQVNSRKQTISQGICPKCGGRLILREGRFGSFYGCSNYPNCRFTINSID